MIPKVLSVEPNSIVAMRTRITTRLNSVFESRGLIAEFKAIQAISRRHNPNSSHRTSPLLAIRAELFHCSECQFERAVFFRVCLNMRLNFLFVQVRV